jgi:hypothetical protein
MRKLTKAEKENFIAWFLTTAVRSDDPEAESVYRHTVAIIKRKQDEGFKMKTKIDLFKHRLPGTAFADINFMFAVYSYYVTTPPPPDIQERLDEIQGDYEEAVAYAEVVRDNALDSARQKLNTLAREAAVRNGVKVPALGPVTLEAIKNFDASKWPTRKQIEKMMAEKRGRL